MIDPMNIFYSTSGTYAKINTCIYNYINIYHIYIHILNHVHDNHIHVYLCILVHICRHISVCQDLSGSGGQLSKVICTFFTNLFEGRTQESQVEGSCVFLGGRFYVLRDEGCALFCCCLQLKEPTRQRVAASTHDLWIGHTRHEVGNTCFPPFNQLTHQNLTGMTMLGIFLGNLL